MDYEKLRIFAGEYQHGNIKPLHMPDSKDFKDEDCVVVLHRDDYLKLKTHQRLKKHLKLVGYFWEFEIEG